MSQPCTRKLVPRPGAVSGRLETGPSFTADECILEAGYDPMAFCAGGFHRGQCPSKRTDSIFAQNCVGKPARTADSYSLRVYATPLWVLAVVVDASGCPSGTGSRSGNRYPGHDKRRRDLFSSTYGESAKRDGARWGIPGGGISPDQAKPPLVARRRCTV